MAFLQCPNSKCNSHGPFQVTELSEGNGHAPRKVLQCSLCNTVIAILANGHRQQATVEFPEKYELALNRLETNIRNIQSSMAHLRSQLSSLTGRVHKRL